MRTTSLQCQRACWLCNPGVFNLLGHVPPQVCLISLAPPPPIIVFTHSHQITLLTSTQRSIKAIKTAIYFSFALFDEHNLHKKCMDPLYWCTFDIYFTVYVHVLCLRGYSRLKPLVFTCCLRRLCVRVLQVCARTALRCLGLKITFMFKLTKTKHVRMKHFLEEAALAWSLI